jgi:hypothetical protein
VRNNLVSALHVDGEAMTVDHNLVVQDPAAFFVDPARFDLRLRPGCRAIDAGSGDLAPAADIGKIARPQGQAVDVGAHEYRPQ